MISKTAQDYCCEDISNIENYQEAISDSKMWHIHHKREDEGYAQHELIEHNLYFNRPASELIFLREDMHRRRHSKKQPKNKKPSKLRDHNYSVVMHVTPELKVFIGISNSKSWIYEGMWRNTAIHDESKRFGWNNINHVLVEDGLTKERALQIRKRLIEVGESACLNKKTVKGMDLDTNILNSKNMKKEKRSELMASTVNGVKLSLTFDNRYESKTGYPVVIRVYKDRVWTYVKTGFSMTANEFKRCDNDTMQALEQKYQIVRDWCMKSMSDGSFSVKDAKNCLIGNKPKNTLVELIKLKMETVNGKSTLTSYDSTIKYVLKVFPDGLPVKSISHITLNDIIKRMKLDGRADTTVNIYMSIIKASINYAIYKGLFEESKYPFKKNPWECDKISLPKSAKRQDRWVDIDEIRAIWDKFVENKNKMKRDRWIGIFLFSYLTGGMNLADIVELRYTKEWITKGIIRWTRRKTAHKKNDTIAIPVCSKLNELLEIMGSTPKEGELVFKFLEGDYYSTKAKAATCANRILKEFGVSMTYARHSFCTIMNKLGAPYSMVEAAMGHSTSGVSSHYIAPYTPEEMLPWFEKLI